MNVNEPSVHSAAEDLSDRSNSSNSESQLHAFQEYGKIKELNLSINRAKDLSPNKTKDFSFALDGSRQYGSVSLGSLTADRPTKDLPVALDKPKEFDFQSEKIKDASNYSLDRSEDTDASLDANPQNRPKDKDVIFSFDGIKDAHFPREARDARTKNVHFPLDKNKDSNFQKTYNHPLDRIKEFSFGLDRRQDSQIGGVALERLRGGSFLEPADYRNPQVQPRDEFEVLAMERMRRSHILASDMVPRNLPPHLPHPHSITEMQHSQQQQQQQGKSFTIDSILGLRNNQREKPQRSQLHPYRKHQGQEGSVKNSSSGSSAGCGGKLKRVRTIFTAEQLERLEGEFARQQYMVGPERLYLAHALRLTEAQVKVWFQNRRIKWRKLHHEQQSQRLHELHSLSSLEQDAEDSNDNGDRREAFKQDFPRSSSEHSFLEELEAVRKQDGVPKSLKIACSRSRTLDTISEHTEPSPVPSTTMDQTDLEAQSQTRKLRRGRHSASNWSSYASRLPTDGTSASDCHWKTIPRLTHSVPHSHEHRRQDYGIAEPVTSCYSALNTYRPKHRSSVSPLPKLSHIPASDQSYRTPAQQSVRTARNKLLTTNNLAVVRKGCYKDDVEEDDDINEEEGNYADDNVEEEAAEEADEDQDDQPYEYNDKDYEEQEADDEVDDESDAFQAQLHRVMQHKTNKAVTQRSQPVRHADHQQDLRKVHHQPHAHRVYQDQKPQRFYPQSLETQQPIVHDTSYGDAAEVVSDDQHTPPWTPEPRRSTRRSSETNPSWVPTRKSGDRNRDRVTSPAVTGHEQQRYHRQHQLQLQQAQLQHQQQQRQQVRKHKSSKPEIESLMMPPPSNPTTKKCCLCGGSTAPYTAMVGSTRKENCRLHEYRGFTVRGPSGEDGEAEEQVVCGRCERRYNKEDLRLGCETSPPEAGVPIYPAKSNRSRIHRSSTYNFPEDNQTVDEMLAAYASSQPRTSSADYGMAPRERTRHSVQTSRSPTRRASYYER